MNNTKASSNKKLLETSASLLVTSALLVVTRGFMNNTKAICNLDGGRILGDSRQRRGRCR